MSVIESIKEIIKNNNNIHSYDGYMCMLAGYGGAAGAYFGTSIRLLKIYTFNNSGRYYRDVKNRDMIEYHNQAAYHKYEADHNNLIIQFASLISGCALSLFYIFVAKPNINLFHKDYFLNDIMHEYITTSNKSYIINEKYNSYIIRTKIHGASDIVAKMFGMCSVGALCFKNNGIAAIYCAISSCAFLVRQICNLKKYERKLVKALD